jgi:hypothetical protein
LQLAGKIGGEDCIAIADGAGESGSVAVGGDIFSKHAAGGIGKGGFFYGTGGARGADGGEDQFAGRVEGEGGH